MNFKIVYLLLLLPLSLVAQDYKEGRIIKETGDTVEGFINSKALHTNPEAISFKLSLGDINESFLSLEDIKAFDISECCSYVKYTVRISVNELERDKLSGHIDTSTLVKTVLLKEIVKGDRLNFYAYRDQIKERFFILDKRHGQPIELIYRKGLKDFQEYSQALYRQQLQFAAIENGANSPSLARTLETLEYSQNELAQVVRKINSVNTEVPSLSVRKKHKGRFFVGFGVSQSRMVHSGKSWITVDRLTPEGHNKYKDEVATSSTLPLISSGFVFSLDPVKQRFLLRLDVTGTRCKSNVTSHYKHNNYSQDEIEYEYNLSGWNLFFAPQFLYNFVDGKNLKGYFGGGAAFKNTVAIENSLKTTDVRESKKIYRETKENYLPIRQNNLCLVMRTGFCINQCFDFSVLWSSPTEYSGYISGPSIKGGVLALTTAYYFHK